MFFLGSIFYPSISIVLLNIFILFTPYSKDEIQKFTISNLPTVSSNPGLKSPNTLPNPKKSHKPNNLVQNSQHSKSSRNFQKMPWNRPWVTRPFRTVGTELTPSKCFAKLKLKPPGHARRATHFHSRLRACNFIVLNRDAKTWLFYSSIETFDR